MSISTKAQESIPPEESADITGLAARLKAQLIQSDPSGAMHRDAHPKMHGLLKAEFTVEPDLSPELRIGVFKQASTYRAWIRFSNASRTMEPDIKNDIRGMAIKLMGVPGEKLLEQEKDETTQDFLLINSPVFLTRNLAEFIAMEKAVSSGNLLSIAGFFLTHLHVGWRIFKALGKCAGLLQTTYYSSTPYLFGSNAVKYCAAPQVSAPTPAAIPATPAGNYLRQELIQRLSGGEVLFDFSVQLQTDPDSMPIEDPSCAWPEEVSPLRKVATIRILQQNFATPQQNELGENMSFTPWHALPEHRPLGSINRARKTVYQVISAFRHEASHVARKEPVNWDL